MREALRKDPNDHVRRYSEESKRRQAEMRKEYEEEEKRRMEKEYDEYRKYHDSGYSDMSEKMKGQINRTAQNIANNVKDALKMGEQLKDMWDKFSSRKKK